MKDKILVPLFVIALGIYFAYLIRLLLDWILL